MKKSHEKMIAGILVILLIGTVFTGCRSSGGPGAAGQTAVPSSYGEIVSSSTVEKEASSTVQTETGESTEIAPSDTICSDPDLPAEMTMEEIEAQLGFGYQLPDVSEHNGRIQCTIDNDSIALGYSSNEFAGRVVIWKSVQSDEDKYDTWEQWAEAGKESVKGTLIRFRGNSPDHKGIAFWSQDGYQYVMNCETAPGSDIMSILPLFIENKTE